MTVTMVDRASPDQICGLLFRSAMGARYKGMDDASELVPREVKDTLIFPFSEL